MKSTNTLPTEDGPAETLRSGDWFGLFAAHAPEIPKWFDRKEWDECVTVPAPDISPNHVRWGSKHHVEEPLAHLVRWRMTYAAAMVAALPNNPVSNAVSETEQQNGPSNGVAL